MVECNFDKSHCFCDGFVDHYYHRAVGRSENPGLPVLFGGHNLPHLVEITYMPKSGGAMAVGTPGTPRDDRPVSERDAKPDRRDAGMFI